MIRGGTSNFLTATSHPGPHRGGALNTNSTNHNPKKRKREDFESFLSQHQIEGEAPFAQGMSTRSRKRIRPNNQEGESHDLLDLS